MSLSLDENARKDVQLKAISAEDVAKIYDSR
jgi:hypothetical protein